MPVVQIAVEIDEKGVVRGVAGINQELEKAGAKGKVVFTQLSDETGKLTRKQKEAAEASQLLASRLGVEVPRSLQAIIAKSNLVGPALSAAFKFTAALAAIGILVSMRDEIGKVIDRFYDLDGAVKRTMEAAAAHNKIILDGVRQRLRLEEELALIGLKGSRAVAEQQQLADKRIAAAQANVNKLQADLDALVKKSTETFADRGAPAYLVIAKQLTEEAKKAAAELREGGLQGALELANQQLLEAKVNAEKLGKQLIFSLRDEGAEAAQKLKAQLQELNRVLLQARAAMRTAEQEIDQTHGIRGELVPPPGGRFSRDFLEQVQRDANRVRDIERQLEIDRLQSVGRFVKAALLQEQIRVEQTTAELRKLNASEEVIARARKSIHEQTMNEIAARHREAVERMADDLERFFSDPKGEIMRAARRMGFMLIAQLLLGMQQGRTSQAGGGGGILDILFGGIFGGGGLGGIFTGGRTPPTFPSPGGGNPFIGGLLGGFGGSLGSSFGSSFGLPFSAGAGGIGTTTPAGASGGGGLLDRLFTRGIGRAGSPFSLTGPQVGVAGLGLGLLGFTRGSPLIGAAGGALTGFAIGGPIGAIIGGIVGFFAGLFGRGKKRKQRDQIEAQAFRAIAQVKQAYNLHQLDYLSAIAQLEQVREQVNQAMRQLKWPSRMDPHIDRAIREIQATEAERQRRDQLPFGGPQFAAGGYVNEGLAAPAFGGPGAVVPFRSSAVWPAPRFDSGGAVPAIVHTGEYIINRRAVQRHGRAKLDAMNNGHDGGAGWGGIVINGPLIQAQRVDEAWLRNGGADEIMRALRRAAREGAR